MDKTKPKVIVIGLDGATFTNLKPWMDEGLLPNLKFLVDNGASGELGSTIPRLSSPAWVSFMTGVNPGKHDVFSFLKPFRDKRYRQELVTSNDIKAKTIFEILSEKGKVSGIINLPMTYPPFKINGFMVSCGLTTPSTDFNFTYPDNLFDKIGLMKTEYILDINPTDYHENEKENFFYDLIKCAEKRKEISFKLMDIYDWDLFMLIFTGTDRLQHFYWHYIDPSHFKYNPIEAQKILPLVIKYYQKLDSIIGEFINYIDDNTSLIIISDHGFGPLEKFIAVHKILRQVGFLYHKKETLLTKVSKMQHEIRGILHRHSIVYKKTKEITKLIYNKLRKKNFNRRLSIENVQERLGVSSDNYWQTVDWQKTIAYLGTAGNSIYLNIKGREPEGIIKSDEEYQEMRNKIIDLINNLYQPLSKQKFKIKVYKKEEIYNGPYSLNGPDIYFEIEKGRYSFLLKPYSKEIFGEIKGHTGGHTRDGIIILYGNNFKRSYYVENAQIIDLAPTILYLLRTKIPEYMDGKVIKDALKDGLIKNRHIDVNKYSRERNTITIKKQVYSEQEMENVKKHLADLGYL